MGRVDTNQANKPTLRSIAVLEYTGDLAKPTASRLVPIAVWDGETYQPGGLYLAQPVPLTVQTGTQYVLQVAGTPKGFFDVNAASDVGGSWIAIGTYQKPTSPNYAKLRRSRNLPVLFGSGRDDKPHFAHVPTGDTNLGATKTTAQNNAPPVDPDRPTLHRRTDDASSQGTSSASNGTSTASDPAPPVDPDRPILHEPPKPSPNNPTASGGESPETATTAVDPNRPHLEYGRPGELESLDVPAEIAKLAAHPQEIEQITAISDATNHPVQSFVYSWDDPQDKIKMQSAVEAIAQDLLAKSAQHVTKPVTNSHTTHTTTRKPARKTAKPALPMLTDEQFNAYQLTNGGGATLVFSATSGQGDAARYITLIAQPDFNGTPIVLFKQITSERELNIIPRMKLIDAVDTNADNRAELIFALENQTGRQYAIYRVADNTVEQLFVTGS
ncbi:MAG: hypothetical protein WA634_12880 [Silvibacterium sp.]